MTIAVRLLHLAVPLSLAIAGSPQQNAVLSLPVTAQAGAEAWPLQPEHLEITCDGMPIASTALRRVNEPMSVGIVVQPTKYVLDHIADVQAALRAFLGQIRQGDEFFTVNSLDHPVLGVGFTSDPGAIVSSVALPVTKRQAHLYDGLDFALHYLENARNSERVLVVIFAWEDVASEVQAKDIKAKILAAHVPTYVVSLYARTPDDFAPTLYELTRVAIDSGGDIWEVMRSNKLPQVMSGMRIRPEYMLDLRPAVQCRQAEIHAINLNWNPGVAHRGVLLRYQRKLPAQ